MDPRAVRTEIPPLIHRHSLYRKGRSHSPFELHPDRDHYRVRAGDTLETFQYRAARFVALSSAPEAGESGSGLDDRHAGSDVAPAEIGFCPHACDGPPHTY